MALLLPYSLPSTQPLSDSSINTVIPQHHASISSYHKLFVLNASLVWKPDCQQRLLLALRTKSIIRRSDKARRLRVIVRRIGKVRVAVRSTSATLRIFGNTEVLDLACEGTASGGVVASVTGLKMIVSNVSCGGLLRTSDLRLKWCRFLGCSSDLRLESPRRRQLLR